MEKCLIVRRLYFRDGKTTGSLWERETFPNGVINRLYGCRFIGHAFEQSSDLQPGDRIRPIDGEVEILQGDTGPWKCWVVREYEKVSGGGESSEVERFQGPAKAV